MKTIIPFVLATLLPLILFSQDEISTDSLKKDKFHYDLYIGTFIPTQEAELIGVKPVFGLSGGINNKKMTYDLTLEFRFGNTKDSYELSNSEMTNNYFGGYLGIDMMREILGNKKNKVMLLGGVGVDLFEIEPAEYEDASFVHYILFGEDRIQTKQSRNIFSHNLNFGLMYRIYNKKGNYYGIRYRYNIVNYNSKKVLTDLTGNFHSITFSFGGISKSSN